MKRLTYDFQNMDGTISPMAKSGFQSILEKLYQYEKAEEQGLLLKLPCKIGDTVYHIDYLQKTVEEDVLLEYSMENDDWYVRLRDGSWTLLEMFKRHYFLTKAEAETKLKEIK